MALLPFCIAIFTLLSWSATADYVIFSNPPQPLLPGQKLTYDLTYKGLPYGPHALAMQPDCNLVLHNFKAQNITWATNTSGMGNNCYLMVDSHGEAFVRRNMHYPVWRSNVNSVEGNYAFLIQWNGAVAVYGPDLWSSSNPPELSNSEMMTLTTDYVFYAYQVMPIGLILAYKNYELILQDDCNLVLKNTDTGDIKWQTNTYSDRHDCFTTLERTGEFFVKHNRRDILWRSGKTSTPGMYMLVLRFDARLVIYGSQVWTNLRLW